jgi:sugar-phosphatase
LDRIGVAEFFHSIVSAENEPQGKPHPAVYLTAAGKLGVPSAECIAFEDSLPGLQSAKAAGMYCIAVPETHNHGDPRFAAADKILASLEDFQPRWLLG